MTVGSTGDSGGCSLRGVIEAVEAGTSNGCGTVENPTTTIHLPANTITLSSPLVVSKGNMSIVGNESNPAGTVISGGGKDRVMEIEDSATVKLVGLEITGGHTPNAPPSNNVYLQNLVGNGGGILNDGSLTLEHVLVTENQTGHGSLGASAPLKSPGGGGGEGGSGGGIYNEPGASLKIVDSTISKNNTGDGGNGGEGAEGETPANGSYPSGTTGGAGGPSGDGGGIYNLGTTVIEGSTISGNFTGRGGNGGTGGMGAGATSEFSGGEGGDGGEGGNSGEQYIKEAGSNTNYEKGGGGILNAGSLTMSNSTISGNATGAGGLGGGSGAGGAEKEGRFEDSGRAGTGGGGGRGGGLLSGGGQFVASPATLVNVTIYGNRTGDGGTGGGGGGGAANTLGGGVGGWGGDGGGIWAQGARGGSEVLLTHVTIAGNGVGAAGLSGASADPTRNAYGSERGVGAGIATGGRYIEDGAGVYEKNSIIAGNGSPTSGDANCSQHYLPSKVDIVDQGGNVTWGDTTCPGKVADPMLGALANNGGPTETLLPGAGGSAVGAVPAGSCTVHEDQRGLPRPGAGKTNCDAGAVETQSGESPPPGKEEKGGEQPGGGGGNNAGGGAGSGGGAGAGGTGSTSTPKSLQCKKGFKKKTVKGKPKCVKKKTHRHHKP